MNFLVFGNLVKHCPQCLIYHPKTKKKQRNKDAKIYAGYLRWDIQTLSGSGFPLFKFDELLMSLGMYFQYLIICKLVLAFHLPEGVHQQ